MNTNERTWLYEYTHIRVVDGDTIVGDINQGMNLWSRNQYVRFAGINAPERDTDEGKAAKGFLTTLLKEGEVYYLVTVEYHEFEKYGRVLAYIYEAREDIRPDDLMDMSLNQTMLEGGYAVVYNP